VIGWTLDPCSYVTDGWEALHDPASDVVRHVTSRLPRLPPPPCRAGSSDHHIKAAHTLRSEVQPVIFDAVSSLWTPDGEHKVEKKTPTEPIGPEPAASAPRGDPAASGASTGRSDSGPEEREVDPAELDELRKELLEAPVEVVVANHAYGLFELAALHLSSQPPNLPQSRLAIDALGVLVEGLGERLGEVEAPLKEALAQIRLAYVQISGAADLGDERSA
jgi:hypothetical protein